MSLTQQLISETQARLYRRESGFCPHPFTKTFPFMLLETIRYAGEFRFPLRGCPGVAGVVKTDTTCVKIPRPALRSPCSQFGKAHFRAVRVLGPRGCWICTDSQASILGCGDSMTAPELNRASASRKKAGRRVTLEGLCIWSMGALFSAWMPSSKRSFSTRGVSSDLPLLNLSVRVEVKLPGESWEKEGETFYSRHPWKMELR